MRVCVCMRTYMCVHMSVCVPYCREGGAKLGRVAVTTGTQNTQTLQPVKGAISCYPAIFIQLYFIINFVTQHELDFRYIICQKYVIKSFIYDIYINNNF